MIKKNKKLIIVGCGAFAEIAFEYFTYDSEYEVVAFAVESEFLDKESFCGLPVYAVEELEEHFSVDEFYFFAALVYNNLNRLRTRLYNLVKSKGYKPASYISSHTFVWHNVKIGEHCFIFENNTIQPFVEIADNVILWSGNHIGHHSVIKNNCFISSHVVICGFTEIGNNCFLAVNSLVADRVKLADDCFLNSGAIVMKSTKEKEILNPAVTDVAKIDSHKLFKVK
jgi:sugar O-acyltransferase (sialic acid O-acetyltransferase NeuD family)